MFAQNAISDGYNYQRKGSGSEDAEGHHNTDGKAGFCAGNADGTGHSTAKIGGMLKPKNLSWITKVCTSS